LIWQPRAGAGWDFCDGGGRGRGDGDARAGSAGCARRPLRWPYAAATGCCASCGLRAITILAGEWLKRDGDERESRRGGATPADGVRCDAYGCIAKARDGTLVAVSARIDALAEDCATAQIVISVVPARRNCIGPKFVIDKFDVARTGGYAIWLGEPLRVETVEGERGQRPWSAQPASLQTQTA